MTHNKISTTDKTQLQDFGDLTGICFPEGTLPTKSDIKPELQSIKAELEERLGESFKRIFKSARKGLIVGTWHSRKVGQITEGLVVIHPETSAETGKVISVTAPGDPSSAIVQFPDIKSTTLPKDQLIVSRFFQCARDLIEENGDSMPKAAKTLAKAERLSWLSGRGRDTLGCTNKTEFFKVMELVAMVAIEDVTRSNITEKTGLSEETIREIGEKMEAELRETGSPISALQLAVKESHNNPEVGEHAVTIAALIIKEVHEEEPTQPVVPRIEGDIIDVPQREPAN